jgi:hypothetical protein
LMFYFPNVWVADGCDHSPKGQPVSTWGVEGFITSMPIMPWVPGNLSRRYRQLRTRQATLSSAA